MIREHVTTNRGPECQRCLFWKRRSAHRGTCWLEPSYWPGPTVEVMETDWCDGFTQRVYRSVVLSDGHGSMKVTGER